jgi:hypothetical protein
MSAVHIAGGWDERKARRTQRAWQQVGDSRRTGAYLLPPQMQPPPQPQRCVLAALPRLWMHEPRSKSLSCGTSPPGANCTAAPMPCSRRCWHAASAAAAALLVWRLWIHVAAGGCEQILERTAARLLCWRSAAAEQRLRWQQCVAHPGTAASRH